MVFGQGGSGGREDHTVFCIKWNHVPISLERTTPGYEVADDDDDVADSYVPGHYHDRTMVLRQSFSNTL